MGAIGGLRRKPLAWLALNVRVASVYLIDRVRFIGTINQVGGGECDVLGLWVLLR
jgi:hypothetical protein